MFNNLLARVIVGVIGVVILAGMRFYFAFYVLNHVHSVHESFPGGQAMDLSRGPKLPPDHSGWVVFTGRDPATGAVVRHAKLEAAAVESSSSTSLHGNTLQLSSGKTSGDHVRLTLPSLAPCADVTAVKAAFDGHAPVQIAGAVQDAAHCVIEVADYDGFVTLVSNADVMVLLGRRSLPRRSGWAGFPGIERVRG